jgi:NAD(P)-dependent dehydrogenase (short-subunit alcohol dehydrogenase family)
MAESFTPRNGNALAQGRAKRRRVLVTGAAGNIGSYFASHSYKRYQLRLMVHHEHKGSTKNLEKYGEVVRGDLANLEEMKRLCEGIDTVVHMAGDPSPSATWESLLQANIIGAYNMFVAAKAAGCRRMIYASSIHAVSGYPPDVQVKTSEPVNPGDLYGVSKCFGEAMGRYMAEKEGLSTIALRIGAFQPRSAAADAGSIGMLDAWISQRDMNQLLEKCIDVETLQFAILHALSDNRFKRLDISDARELVGFAPQDDLTSLNPKLRQLKLRKEVATHSVNDARQQSGIREELKSRSKRAPSSR